jgi:Fis family transcriptional regulator
MTLTTNYSDSQPAKGFFKVSEKSRYEPLSDCVKEALDTYFAQLDGHPPSDLYQMVMSEVELPLLTCVLEHMGGNQTRAATALGISRSTLRKKLVQYRID